MGVSNRPHRLFPAECSSWGGHCFQVSRTHWLLCLWHRVHHPNSTSLRVVNLPSLQTSWIILFVWSAFFPINCPYGFFFSPALKNTRYFKNLSPGLSKNRSSMKEINTWYSFLPWGTQKKKAFSALLHVWCDWRGTEKRTSFLPKQDCNPAFVQDLSMAESVYTCLHTGTLTKPHPSRGTSSPAPSLCSLSLCDKAPALPVKSV